MHNHTSYTAPSHREQQIQQCSVEQERVYRVVVSCMERNSIGDYDLAYRLLRNVFDEVVCVD